MPIKNSSDTVGNRTRDHSVCGAVLQHSTMVMVEKKMEGLMRISVT